nr:hypothetical protein [Tanacetum cinerariifolium]
MPVWCQMFQQTLDGSSRGWFELLPHDIINEWAELREAFTARFFPMAGPIEGGGREGIDDREETSPPLTKEQIEGHVSALKSLIKSHNQKNKGDHIRLDFEMVETKMQGHTVVKGNEVIVKDFKKPFKEA